MYCYIEQVARRTFWREAVYREGRDVAAYLDDTTWRRLNPHAGRLTRRTTVKLWLSIAACVVLGVIGLALYRSGLVVPRLVIARPARGRPTHRHAPSLRTCWYAMPVLPRSWWPVSAAAARGCA